MTVSNIVLCLLYTAFVLLLFDYCDAVWCPTTAKLTAVMKEYILSLLEVATI